MEAVRIEPETYRHSDAADMPPLGRTFVTPTPVFSTFLDLPLLTGEESEVAPDVAILAAPWPGSVAVYSSATDSGYKLNRLVARRSTIGITESPLLGAVPGIVDRGAPLRVRLISGALSSAFLDNVVNGTNLAAIGDGSASNWELIQFTAAVLVAADTYEISGRLRGQAGTDALPSLDWPTGSLFVLLDGGPKQIDLKSSERGLDRNHRIGPARRSLDDPAFSHSVRAFEGVGLRPYAPTHLRATKTSGDMAVSWVRRTRIDGDSWQSMEVPLGEDAEEYLVRVVSGGTVVREVSRSTSNWSYSTATQAADGVTGSFSVQVAQISRRYGAGLFRRIDIND